MSSNRAETLYFGSALDAKEILECDGGSGNLGEIAAALINALQRIHDLEQNVTRLTYSGKE